MANMNALALAVEPDDACPPSARYAEGHRLIDAYLELPSGPYLCAEGDGNDPWRAIMTASPGRQIAVTHAAIERLAWAAGDAGDHLETSERLGSLLWALLARPLPFDALDLVQILRAATSSAALSWQPWHGIVRCLERYVAAEGLDGVLRPQVWRLRGLLHTHPRAGAFRALVLRLDEVLGIAQPGLPDEGEPWADLLRADLAAMDTDARAAWDALLRHVPATSSARPPRRWLDGAERRVRIVGEASVARHIVEWLDAAMHFAPGALSTRDAVVLTGLVWYCGLLDDARVRPTLTALAAAMLRDTPGTGPRSRQVGYACLYVLARC